MKQNENKRKMEHTEEEIIPGTPKEKHLRKRHRKKSSVDCADLLNGIDFTEDFMPATKNTVTKGELDCHSLNDLLDGIDVFDDFNSEDNQVSTSV